MSRLANAEKGKKDNLVEFTVGNETVKLSPTIIKNYLVNGNGNVTDQEITYFIHLCRARKLNPFIKDVYLIKFGQQPATMVVSKDALEKRAIKNPDYNGKKVGIYVMNKETKKLEKRDSTIYLPDFEKIVGAWCTVFRKDWENPVTVEVNFDEYVQTKSDGTPNTNWANKPVTMITKVAKAQALREAFIEELDGLYEAEEMGINENELDNSQVEIRDVTDSAEIDNYEDVIVEEENPFA